MSWVHMLTYTAPQESKKALKKVLFFTVPPLPTAFWMKVLTLISNSDSNIAVPNVTKYLNLQAKVAGTQDSDSDSSLSKHPDITSSEDESDDKDDEDGDGGEEGKEEEKEPEPPKPEPRTLQHGRQAPNEDGEYF
ncbi:hypothetical protein HDU93_000616 [Gonapodya sp. JEL0774]|nr:hypothetical protein HDU93_000616 [Gonapodya sp. JEL0774]